jgi:hypothetical protein
MPFDRTSHNYQIGYDSGAFAAFNHVLNYLNTIDSNTVDKTKIYKAVFDMRPQHLKSKNDQE